MLIGIVWCSAIVTALPVKVVGVIYKKLCLIGRQLIDTKKLRAIGLYGFAINYVGASVRFIPLQFTAPAVFPHIASRE